MVHADAFDDGLAAYNAGDYAAALNFWKPLAEEGVANAQFSLAGMYANGQGVPQDIAGAARWVRLAAEQGLANAQNNLGYMYAEGQGVPQDDTEAAKWYRKAAEQGHAYAQISLGSMYLYGNGVPQDNTLAHMWFSLAAVHSIEAEQNRDMVAEDMTRNQIAEAQRMAREWMAKHQQ